VCAVPVPRLRGTFCGGDLSLAFFFQSEKGPSSRGLTHFMAAVLPKAHICALKVGDTASPQPAFQKAIIDSVRKVTHIAPADAHGKIIGEEVAQPGVINYPIGDLGLCASVTGAKYTSTTEVYPDSPSATADQCNDAQVAAVVKP